MFVRPGPEAHRRISTDHRAQLEEALAIFVLGAGIGLIQIQCFWVLLHKVCQGSCGPFWNV